LYSAIAKGDFGVNDPMEMKCKTNVAASDLANLQAQVGILCNLTANAKPVITDISLNATLPISAELVAKSVNVVPKFALNLIKSSYKANFVLNDISKEDLILTFARQWLMEVQNFGVFGNEGSGIRFGYLANAKSVDLKPSADPVEMCFKF